MRVWVQACCCHQHLHHPPQAGLPLSDPVVLDLSPLLGDLGCALAVLVVCPHSVDNYAAWKLSEGPWRARGTAVVASQVSTSSNSSFGRCRKQMHVKINVQIVYGR